MFRSDPHSKGWFSVKRILGMLAAFGAMLVLLGGLTGCPDSGKKTEKEKKTTEVEKTEKEKKTTVEEKKTTEEKK